MPIPGTLFPWSSSSDNVCSPDLQVCLTLPFSSLSLLPLFSLPTMSATTFTGMLCMTSYLTQPYSLGLGSSSFTCMTFSDICRIWHFLKPARLHSTPGLICPGGLCEKRLQREQNGKRQSGWWKSFSFDQNCTTFATFSMIHVHRPPDSTQIQIMSDFGFFQLGLIYTIWAVLK